MMSAMSFIMTAIPLLLAMAMFTLVERKFLGYSQMRKGPNKVSFMGLMQPITDAAKLFTKEESQPNESNTLIFMLSPMIMLFMSILMWMLFPSISPSYSCKYGIVVFLCISSLSVYTTLLSGWSSNSKWGLLGGLRGVAQTISYEVSMALILINVLMYLNSFSISHILKQWYMPMVLIMPALFITWFTTMIAETNRAPLDLAEGESELVSGFNIEYGGSTFAMLFMAEYLSIIFLSALTSVILMAPWTMMLGEIKVCLCTILFIYTRTSYPRMRYDKLMHITWTSFLPMSLLMLWSSSSIG